MEGPKMKSLINLTAPLFLALAAGTAVAGPGGFPFFPIPAPSGSTITLPAAISGDGTTVTGAARLTTSGANSAFRFIRGGASTIIASTPSEGNALSADGKVIVGDAGTQGFSLADQATEITPFGGLFTTLAGVSGDGNSFVGNTTVNGVGPFISTNGAAPVSLGFLTGYEDLEVAAISRVDLNVVGTAATTVNSLPLVQAAKKIGSGNWVGLGFLATQTTPVGPAALGTTNGNSESYATDNSGDGSNTVGFSKVGDSFGGFTYHAFRHTDSDGMVRLTSLVSTNFGVTIARGVTNTGLVVGSSESNTAAGQSAVIWLPNETVPRDLLAYAREAPRLADIPAGWILTEAVGVSDNGAFVLGRGVDPSGNVAGFVVQIAENIIIPNAPTCFLDFNADGFLTQDDLGGFLTAFLDESVPPGPTGTNVAPCTGEPAPYDTLGFAADYNRDCSFSQDDLGGFLTDYFGESENPINCLPG